MHVMAERGMNTADKRLVKTFGKRVGACLRHHRTGLIRSVNGLSDRLAWRLAGRFFPDAAAVHILLQAQYYEMPNHLGAVPADLFLIHQFLQQRHCAAR
jgi:hypothetical protein